MSLKNCGTTLAGYAWQQEVCRLCGKNDGAAVAGYAYQELVAFSSTDTEHSATSCSLKFIFDIRRHLQSFWVFDSIDTSPTFLVNCQGAMKLMLSLIISCNTGGIYINIHIILLYLTSSDRQSYCFGILSWIQSDF